MATKTFKQTLTEEQQLEQARIEMERAHARYWEMCGAPSTLKRVAAVTGFIVSFALGYVSGLYVTELLIIAALTGGVPMFLVWAINIIGIFLALISSFTVGEKAYTFIITDGYKAVGTWARNLFRKEADHAAAQ